MIPEHQPELSGFNVPEKLQLEGPFLPESYALRHLIEYRPYICQLARCRIICRDLIVLCDDMTYECRDDIRLELGLIHHRHKLELTSIDGDLTAVAIDNYLLLNPEDSQRIEDYLALNPLSALEKRAFSGMSIEKPNECDSPRRDCQEVS